jgi:DNA-binding CsgD family transcriptional regulator
MNEGNAKAIGCQSIKSAIGRDAHAFLKKGNARRIIQHDIEIMMANKTIISEEDIILKNDDVRSNAIIVKSPWYDHEGHTIGTFACSLVVNAQPITSFLEELSQLSLLSSNHGISQESNSSFGSQIDGVYLSKREAEVLQQMTFGKSARATGEALSISQRTVETHLVHIKKKLKIRSKAELIDKAIYAFYGK